MEITKDYLSLIDDALSLLTKKGVAFGEVRYTKELELKIIAKNSNISEIKRSSDQGIGIRIQAKKGAPLAFVSTSDLSKSSIVSIIDLGFKTSLTLAKTTNTEIALTDPPIKAPKELKHLSSSSLLDEDIGYLKNWVIDQSKAIKGTEISSSSCGLAGVLRYKHVVTTDGIDTSFIVDGIGFKGDATIRANGRFQTYSDRVGGTFGFNQLQRKLDEKETIKEIHDTVIAIVNGRTIKTGTYDVVIDPTFAGLLAHESFGHMTEADSVTSHDSALSDRIGESFASEIVSISDDAISYDDGAWNLIDDEGVPGQKTIMLNQGILEKYLSDRENAFELGTTSTGNSRSQDYGYPPIVRMTNTSFLPGDHSFDEIIEDVKHGVLCKGHAGGEAGNTGKFSFRSQVGYLIENGEITDTLTSVTLNGNILEYLKKIDAVGKDFELSVDCGFGGCGKGGQRAYVGLGGTYLRFRGVAITSAAKKKMTMGMMMK